MGAWGHLDHQNDDVADSESELEQKVFPKKWKDSNSLIKDIPVSNDPKSIRNKKAELKKQGMECIGVSTKISRSKGTRKTYLIVETLEYKEYLKEAPKYLNSHLDKAYQATKSIHKKDGLDQLPAGLAIRVLMFIHGKLPKKLPQNFPEKWREYALKYSLKQYNELLNDIKNGNCIVWNDVGSRKKALQFQIKYFS